MNELLSSEIATTLDKVPLNWAKNARFYFENEYREYWLATVENNHLLITGLDIDFKEISVSCEEALKGKRSIMNALSKDVHVICFKDYYFNRPEALWLLAVIESVTNGKLVA